MKQTLHDNVRNWDDDEPEARYLTFGWGVVSAVVGVVALATGSVLTWTQRLGASLREVG